MRHVACLLAGWLLLQAPSVAEDNKEVKAIATAKDMSRSASFGPIHLKSEGVVIHSAEELVAVTAKSKSAKDRDIQEEMTADVAKLLKVEAIDWKKQMILGVIGEEIVSQITDGKSMTVTFVPFREPLGRAIPRTPKILVLVERFEGEVKFIPKK